MLILLRPQHRWPLMIRRVAGHSLLWSLRSCYTLGSMPKSQVCSYKTNSGTAGKNKLGCGFLFIGRFEPVPEG